MKKLHYDQSCIPIETKFDIHPLFQRTRQTVAYPPLRTQTCPWLPVLPSDMRVCGPTIFPTDMTLRSPSSLHSDSTFSSPTALWTWHFVANCPLQTRYPHSFTWVWLISLLSPSEMILCIPSFQGHTSSLRFFLGIFIEGWEDTFHITHGC